MECSSVGRPISCLTTCAHTSVDPSTPSLRPRAKQEVRAGRRTPTKKPTKHDTSSKAPRVNGAPVVGGGSPGDGLWGLSYGAISVFALTYICYATIYFTRKPYSVVKKSAGADLNLEKSDLGLIDTAFLAMYALGQLTMSSLGDKYGPRIVLAGCFTVSAVVSILFSLSTDLGTLLVLMGINGLAQALLFPLCVKALNPWLPSERRGVALGVWTTSQQVGGVLSTALAGYLALHQGWRKAIELPAYVVVASALALFLYLREPPQLRVKLRATPEPSVAQGDSATVAHPSQHGRFLEAAAIPGLLNLGASYFFVKLARYTLLFWLPFYLGEEHGFIESDAAYLSTLFDVGGVAGSLVCGYVSDKVLRGNRLLVVGPCCVATGALLVMYPTVSHWGSGVNCGMLFLIGFFIAGPDSVLGGAATADACERQGAIHLLTTAGGISNGMGSLGSMAQGPVSSAAISRFGWPGLFRLLGALCLCGSAMLTPQMKDEYRRFWSLPDAAIKDRSVGTS
eukprot:m.59289 g.59289  ORF g.59289 m.59289 type:complete len:510 (-) comp17324_c0_seq1:98-1627(-)